MRTARPDIVVVSPDGEYLIVVEVKLSRDGTLHQSAIQQLKHFMAAFGCATGLVVVSEHVFLLRDSFEQSNGKSIEVIGAAKLPDFLLPPPDQRWEDVDPLKFEAQIQQWLESLKSASSIEGLSSDLRSLLGEPIISLLQLGEVRAAGPRWSELAS